MLVKGSASGKSKIRTCVSHVQSLTRPNELSTNPCCHKRSWRRFHLTPNEGLCIHKTLRRRVAFLENMFVREGSVGYRRSDQEIVYQH